MALQWCDKEACLISTVHTTKGGSDILNPGVVIDYNNTMGGDRADQAMMFYPAMRKPQRNTTKRSSGTFLSNSFGMHTLCSAKVISLGTSFRMLPDYQTPSMAVSRSGCCMVRVVNPEHLTDPHFRNYIPPMEKEAAPTRICVVCCSKRDDSGKKIQKETRFCFSVTSDFVLS